MASLLTVLERKVLGSAQRRIGPNYAGWYGLLQIAADGVKLVVKSWWSRVLGEGSVIWVACVVTFVCGYMSLGLLWCEWCGSGVAWVYLWVCVLLGVSHIGCCCVGWVASGSVWSCLGSARALLMLVGYDVVLVVCGMGVLVPSASGRLSEREEVSLLLGSGVASVVLAFVWFVTLVVEMGRVPFDLGECESELVCGYQTEYPGLLYALWASGEYAVMLSGCCVWVWGVLGSGTLAFLYVKVTGVFMVCLILRATLPRLRIVDLVSFCWS